MNSLEIEQFKKENQEHIEDLTSVLVRRKAAIAKLDQFESGLTADEIWLLNLRVLRSPLRQSMDAGETILENASRLREYINNMVPKFTIQVFRSDDRVIHTQKSCLGDVNGRRCSYTSEESFLSNKKLCPDCKLVFIMQQLAK